MKNKRIVVNSPLGIHLRPAGAMSEAAIKYDSNITFEYKDTKVANVKSFLSILAAGIKCGDEINIICEGSDEEEAMETVLNSLQQALKD